MPVLAKMSGASRLVQLSLDSQGGDAMSAFSKRNIGKPMATVYSEYHGVKNGEVIKKSEVINVANIAQHLSSRFSITNMKSPQAAYDLALLRAGSLTAPVTIVQEQTIGPSLGAVKTLSMACCVNAGYRYYPCIYGAVVSPLRAYCQYCFITKFNCFSWFNVVITGRCTHATWHCRS